MGETYSCTTIVGASDSHIEAIYLLYTDDSILAGPDEKELDDIVGRIKAVGLGITEEGEIEDFLGINIDRVDGNTYHLSQPQLIDQLYRIYI
jgi:hypothetical protein